MLKNAFKKHPLQNRTNVQIKGGGGQRPFEQCSKKLHFFESKASLTKVMRIFAHLFWTYGLHRDGEDLPPSLPVPDRVNPSNIILIHNKYFCELELTSFNQPKPTSPA